MTIQFDRAKWSQDGEGFWLQLRVKIPQVAKEFVSNMPDKLHVAELKIFREKRSLDANSYFWVLAEKLAAKLQMSPKEVYRQYIPDVADNYIVQPVREDMIERWDKIWCAGHLGRMTDDIGECRHTPGYHNIRCYLSSSDYDTAQMSRLIELLVQDCKEQGIETMTPSELSRLTNAWGEMNE